MIAVTALTWVGHPVPAGASRNPCRHAFESQHRRVSSWSSRAPHTTRPTTWPLSELPAGGRQLPLGAGVAGLAGRDRLWPHRRRPPRGRSRRPRQGCTLRPHDVRDQAEPGGLHAAYHQLVCGDWWERIPTPASTTVRARSLRDDTALRSLVRAAVDRDTGQQGLPYMAVIDYNDDPTIAGSQRTGFGGLPARMDGRPDRGVYRVADHRSLEGASAGSSRPIIR